MRRIQPRNSSSPTCLRAAGPPGTSSTSQDSMSASAASATIASEPVSFRTGPSSAAANTTSDFGRQRSTS